MLNFRSSLWSLVTVHVFRSTRPATSVPIVPRQYRLPQVAVTQQKSADVI